MTILLCLVLWIGGDKPSSLDVHRVARINAAKKQAETLYNDKAYSEAFQAYRMLTDSFKIQEQSVWLNMGHAAFMAGKLKESEPAYQQALKGQNTFLKSVAAQQLGLASLAANDKDKAIARFKEALLFNPTNEVARYNYELALKQKKKEEQNKPKPKENEQEDKKEDQKEDQGKKNQENKKQKEEKPQDQPGEEEKEKDAPQPFKEIKISEEKAKALLEAMKNNEKQYLQQLKKEPKQSTSKAVRDW
jgi:alpha-galactosidase/6-phospho-beta-glucosidase family protein